MASNLSPLDSEILTISSAAEIAYCPRSFWYEVHHGRRKARNAAVEAGFQEDQDRLDRKIRTTHNVIRHYGVPVFHADLGIRGEVDLVEDSGESLVPVEYRHGTSPGTATDRIAITLIAICLETSTGRSITTAKIYFSSDKQSVEVAIDELARDKAISSVSEARKILKSPHPPPNSMMPICSGCSWFDVCSPDLTVRANNGDVKVRTRRRFDRVLYVDEPGCSVKLKGDSIQVVKLGKEGEADESIVTIGIETLDQLILSGRGVHASLPTIRKLGDSGIDVILVTHTGRYEGRFVVDGRRNPILRRAQHRRSLDPVFRFETARTIVAAKIANQRVVLQRQKRNKPSDDLESILRDMKEDIDRAMSAENIDALRGYEGLAARRYFRGISEILSDTPFILEKRNRRPPTDPTNALLSFCYALLGKETEAALLRVGLDPCLGFYHSEVYGRPALALDLMEEFRPVIADAVALRLINQKILKEDDFHEKLGAIRLSDPARKRLFHAWEGRMVERMSHPLLETTYSLRRTIEIQARLLAKVFEGDLIQYIPLRIR